VTNSIARQSWRQRDVTCRSYILATNEPSQKRNIYGLPTAREMWLKIESQYALNAADIESTCLLTLYHLKHDAGTKINILSTTYTIYIYIYSHYTHTCITLCTYIYIYTIYIFIYLHYIHIYIYYTLYIQSTANYECTNLNVFHILPCIQERT